MFCIIRAVHLLSVSTLDLIYHVLPPLFCVLFHFIFNDVLSCSSVMSNSLPPFVAHQAPLSMGFSRQEYWSGLPFRSPGDLPDPGIKPGSPALQADSLNYLSYRDVPTSPTWCEIAQRVVELGLKADGCILVPTPYHFLSVSWKPSGVDHKRHMRGWEGMKCT